MKEKFWQKNGIYMVLAVIILMQAGYVTHVFACKKVSFHSDEIWTYGLANSSEGPYLFAEEDKTTIRNFDEWLDGSVLRDYVSVRKEERFDYASVWNNLSHDDHPPLYFAILHTVCSLLPGKYSLWYGFVINVICFCVGQFFLFALARNESDSNLIGLAAVILWGTCTGSLNMNIFVRHYEMSLMWAIILMYCYSRMMKRKQFAFGKDILPIAVVTFLGCMTNYLFVAFAFFFTGVFVFYFLFTRRYKTCAVFAVSVLAAVALMGLAYPAVLTRPFQKTGEVGKKANFDYQLLYCIYYAMGYVFGIHTKPYHTMTLIYVEYGVAAILAVALVAALLFRKEDFFKRFLEGSVMALKKAVLTCWQKARNFPVILLAMAVSVTGILVLTAWMVNVPRMGEFTDRYLSVAFPALSVGVLLVIYRLAELFLCGNSKKNFRKVLFAACVLAMLWNSRATISPYVFWYGGEDYLQFKEVAAITNDSDCIIGLGQRWQLTMMPEALFGVRRFYAFCEYDYKTAAAQLEESYSKDTDARLYVLLDESSTNLIESYAGYSIIYENAESYQYSSDKMVEMVQNLSFCNEMEYLGFTAFNGVRYCLYEIK